MSRFGSVQVAPPIEVFHVNSMCVADSDPNKVNLSIGAYRTEEGLPWVLPAVRKAEALVITPENTPNHEYLPVLGYEPFSKAATALLLGDDSQAIKLGKAFGVQCLSGTGSLRAGMEFLHSVLGHTVIYSSNPTWGNHKLIAKVAGFTQVKEYRYWDEKNKTVDIAGFIKDLEDAPEKAVILLHGCAHNPTGMDPTHEQWKQICQVIQKKNLFPFFDVAYQGFASGDPARDAWSVRYFVEQGVELFCAQSFAKNMGLYNERIGNLTIVVNDAAVIPAIKSQLSLVIRANWSNPPNHGAKVVHMILTNPELRKEWEGHINDMSSRIISMRKALRTHLETMKTPGTWEHITQQIGMFSYTGLTPVQCESMQSKHHMYLLKSGRINCCGLNTKNVQRVAKAMDDVVRNTPSSLRSVKEECKVEIKCDKKNCAERQEYLERLRRVAKLKGSIFGHCNLTFGQFLKAREAEIDGESKLWKRAAQNVAIALTEEFPARSSEETATIAKILQANNISFELVGFNDDLQEFEL